MRTILSRHDFIRLKNSIPSQVDTPLETFIDYIESNNLHKFRIRELRLMLECLKKSRPEFENISTQGRKGELMERFANLIYIDDDATPQNYDHYSSTYNMGETEGNEQNTNIQLLEKTIQSLHQQYQSLMTKITTLQNDIDPTEYQQLLQEKQALEYQIYFHTEMMKYSDPKQYPNFDPSQIKTHRDLLKLQRGDKGPAVFIVSSVAVPNAPENGYYCESLKQAMDNVLDGDTIHLYSGVHSAEGLFDIQTSISIIGIGDKKDIIIQNSEDADFFIESKANKLIIQNVTLKQLNGYEGIVGVKEGQVELIDCDLQCSTSGVFVSENAKIRLIRNKIHGSVGEGVLINEGAEAYLESNEIFNNGRGSNLVAKGRGGIVIRVKSGTNPAGYGIAIEKSPNLYKSDVFYGTNIKTENIVMQNNSLGEIGKIIFDQDY